MANSNLWRDTSLYGWGYAHQGAGYTDTPKSLDHANVGVGVTFTTTEDCDITHMNFCCSSVYGTSPYYKVKLWAMVDDGTNYNPDMSGSPLAESAAFQVTIDGYNPSYFNLHEVAFTSAYSATKGTTYMATVVYDSGTIDGSNKAYIEWCAGRNYSYGGMTGVCQSYSGSATDWYGSSTYMPAISVTTDEGYNLGGTLHLGDNSFTVTTNGHRVCQKITMPAEVDGAGLEMYCIGLHVSGAAANTTDHMKVGAWDAAGNALISIATHKADWSSHGNGSIGHYLGEYRVYFAEPLLMTSGNVYYIGWEGDNSSGSCTIQSSYFSFDEDQTTCERSWPMAGKVEGAHWDGSSWNDSWTNSGRGKSRWLINPIISDLYGTSSGGGGSSISGPSMGIIG